MDIEPLENPRDNPCFGCGPSNQAGLGLTFHRGRDEQGAFVGCQYTPTEEGIGWPGLLHGGLHFTLLYETSYWAALTLGPGLMTARGQLTFEEATTPRVGRRLETTGRIEGREDGRYQVVARSLGQDGRLLGSLMGTWAPVARDPLEAAGLDLPGYLWDEVAEPDR